MSLIDDLLKVSTLLSDLTAGGRRRDTKDMVEFLQKILDSIVKGWERLSYTYANLRLEIVSSS